MDQDFEFQRQSGEIDQLMAAMNRAQLAMVPARKDSTNPFFHSKYADLPAVWDALHSFRAEGIVATQSPMEGPEGYIVLETQLTHTSGQWMRSRLKMRVGKDDPQGYGSAITYARRYALGAMTGLVTEEDDDGNAASPQPTTKTFAQKFPEQAKAIKEKLATQQPLPATNGTALSNNDLANIYDKHNTGRPARTLPMDAVIAWAAKSTDLFTVGADDCFYLKEKLSASMMTGEELKQAVAGAQKASDTPASLLPSGGSWVVPFGKSKGQKLIDVTDTDVDYLLKYYLGKLNDAANATSRYRDEWESAVLEIRAEQLARFPVAQ